MAIVDSDDIIGLASVPFSGSLITASIGEQPIVLGNHVRGTLHSILDSGDMLTDITGPRLQEGMLVYLRHGYSTFESDTYYTYRVQPNDDIRSDSNQGALPNENDNWTKLSLGGTSFGSIDSEHVESDFLSRILNTTIDSDILNGVSIFNGVLTFTSEGGGTTDIPLPTISVDSDDLAMLESELSDMFESDINALILRVNANETDISNLPANIRAIRDSDAGNTVADRLRIIDGDAPLDFIQTTPNNNQVLAYDSSSGGSLHWIDRTSITVAGVHEHFADSPDILVERGDFDNDGDSEIRFNLETSGVTADTYGSDTMVPVITVNNKGIATSISNVNIQYPVDQLIQSGEIDSNTENLLLYTTDNRTGTPAATIDIRGLDIYPRSGDINGSNLQLWTGPFVGGTPSGALIVSFDISSLQVDTRIRSGQLSSNDDNLLLYTGTGHTGTEISVDVSNLNVDTDNHVRSGRIVNNNLELYTDTGFSQNQVDIDITSLQVIESDNIESELLARLLDHGVDQNDVKIFAQTGERLITETDLDSDLRTNKLLTDPAVEIQTITYTFLDSDSEHTPANIFEFRDGSPEQVRITLPANFVSGYSAISTPVNTNLLVDGTRSDARFLRIFSGEDQTDVFPTGMYISPNIDGSNAVEITGATFSGSIVFVLFGNSTFNPFVNGSSIYIHELFEHTTVEINFDSLDSDSDITEIINVEFNDLVGPEAALNAIKAVVDSEYADSDSDSETGFITTDAFQDSDSDSDWHIDINTNSNRDLEVMFTLSPGSGINATEVEGTFSVSDGTDDNKPTILSIIPPTIPSTPGMPLSVSLTSNKSISAIIATLIATVEDNSPFIVVNDSDTNTLTFTDTIVERVLGLWDISAFHAAGTGTLVFNTGVETQVGTTGNVLSNDDVVRIIENESDLNLSPNIIDSDHINDDLLARFLDHTFVKDYALAEDGRLILESDLDSDIAERLLVFPTKEIQEIIYDSDTHTNRYSESDGISLNLRLTVPSDIRSGTLGNYDIELIGDIVDNTFGVSPDFIILNADSDVLSFNIGDIIAFDSDSDSRRRLITGITGRSIFTRIYPFEIESVDQFNGNRPLYIDRTPRRSSVLIDFDTTNAITSILPSPLVANFDDSDDAIGILTTIKDTIESDSNYSEYAGFSVTDPDSDSDGNFFIEIDTNIRANLNTSHTIFDNNGTDFGFARSVIRVGAQDGVPTIITISGPDGLVHSTYTVVVDDTLANPFAPTITTNVITQLLPRIESDSTWTAAATINSSGSNVITITNTLEEEVGLWSINVNNGTGTPLDSDLGNLTFGTAIATLEGNPGNRRTDAEIITAIEGDTTLDLSDAVIGEKHIESEFLGQIKNTSQWEAYADDYAPESNFGYLSTGGIAFEDFDSETHDNADVSWPTNADITIFGENESDIVYTPGAGNSNVIATTKARFTNNTGATIDLNNARLDGSITFHNVPTGGTDPDIFVRLRTQNIVELNLDISTDQTIVFNTNITNPPLGSSNLLWESDSEELAIFLFEADNAKTPFSYTINYLRLSYTQTEFAEVYRDPEMLEGFSNTLTASAKYRGITTSYGEPDEFDYTYTLIPADSEVTDEQINNIPDWESDADYDGRDAVFYRARGNGQTYEDPLNLIGQIWVQANNSVAINTPPDIGKDWNHFGAPIAYRD